MPPFRSLFERFAAKAPAEKAPGPEGLDLLSAEFLSDPYPFYRFLRHNDPVHRTRQGSWLLTTHAQQVEAFSNPLLGNAPSGRAVINARNAGRYTSASVARNILPFLDRPQQIRPRRIVGSVFRAALRDMPGDLEGEASDLLRSIARQGPFDLIADYAEPFSVSTISRLMGLPAEDAPRLSHWASLFFFLFAPMPSDEARQLTDTGLEEFRAYLRDALTLRRGSPGADILTRLMIAEDDEGRLDDEQIIDNCMLLFADGVENVDRGFANTMLALHRNDAAWRKLREEPGLAEQAIVEGLRYDPPAQMIGRVAREDVEIGGKLVRKDASVLLAVASANRDPEAYAEPDQFRMDRSDEKLLTFGRGRHSCLGAPLVRQQMRAALQAILVHADDLSIDTSALRWEARLGHRWLSAVPARIRLRR